ncbi:helix-turn-helix domain-containing protein [Micromonospora sp. NPDC005367]|uniref:helix-turn-helix domain-containing protein n=1 Tax=Micromonospora sp. NPDC005367 TaxID=3155590 RepID=UPI0033A3CB9A
MHDFTHTPAGGAAAVKVALLASRDLRANERLILVAIAAHTNRDGDAWPSVATIAEYAGVSTRTVQRCLVKLVQLGRLVVRQVANVTTRVYRLVTGQPAGGDSERQGVTNGGPGGDSPKVSPEVGEDQTKLKGRAAARDWRRFLPKNKTPQQQPCGYPERRGAALPPDRRTDRCPRHIGERADNCRCCRSEALAVGR